MPAAWQNRSIRVKAELEPVAATEKRVAEAGLKGCGCLRGKIVMTADFEEPVEDFEDFS